METSQDVFHRALPCITRAAPMKGAALSVKTKKTKRQTDEKTLLQFLVLPFGDDFQKTCRLPFPDDVTNMRPYLLL